LPLLLLSRLQGSGGSTDPVAGQDIFSMYEFVMDLAIATNFLILVLESIRFSLPLSICPLFLVLAVLVRVSRIAEPVGKRVRRHLRGCGVEEARGFSNWPHVSAPSPVVLPAEHGGRTTGWRCPYSLFRGRDVDADLCLIKKNCSHLCAIHRNFFAPPRHSIHLLT
jgi:hypothetical protein